jgi:hypothetical protein
MLNKNSLRSANRQEEFLTVRKAANLLRLKPTRLSAAIRGKHLRFFLDGHSQLVRLREAAIWRERLLKLTEKSLQPEPMPEVGLTP